MDRGYQQDLINAFGLKLGALLFPFVQRHRLNALSACAFVFQVNTNPVLSKHGAELVVSL